MNSVFKINKMINQHFKLSKWYLVFFLSLYLILLTIGFSFLHWGNENWFPFSVSIGTYEVSIDVESDVDDMFFRLTRHLFFATPGFVCFAIVTIFLVKKYVMSEIKSVKISYWISTSNSRGKIIFSKFLFIVLFNLIIFFPQFFITTLIASIAGDANQYFWYVFYSELNFILCLIMFISLFFCLGVALSYKTKIFDLICSAILIYFIITYILSLLTFVVPFLNNLFHNVHYFSFDLFSEYILDFKEPDYGKEIFIHIIRDGRKVSYYSYDLNLTKIYLYLPMISFNIFNIVGLNFTSISLFKNKNLQ